MSSSAAEEFENLVGSGSNDAILTFVLDNFAEFSFALRLAAIVENPSDADLAAVGCGVPVVRADENLNEIRHSVYNPLADPRAILAALRERAEARSAAEESNRDLIARALRLAAIVENPSDADMEFLRSPHRPFLLRGVVEQVLAALRERAEVK